MKHLQNVWPCMQSRLVAFSASFNHLLLVLHPSTQLNLFFSSTADADKLIFLEFKTRVSSGRSQIGPQYWILRYVVRLPLCAPKCPFESREAARSSCSNLRGSGLRN